MFPRMLMPLFALLILLQSAHAFAVSTPLPTIAQEATSSPPEPTVGLSLNRRASASNLATRGCGWVNTKLYDDEIDNTTSDPASIIYCNTGYNCVFHKSNAAFSGAQGCCSKTGSGFDCGFRTKCYNKATVKATPSLTESPKFFDLFCTSGRNTLCVELTWAGAYTGFYCASSAALYSVYTKATWYDDGYKSTVTQTMTTVNDKILSSLVSRWEPKNSTSQQNVQVPTPAPNVTATTSSTSSPPESTAGSSDSGSSSSTGAIAGGVVGGLAGGAALAAGVIFLVLRRKKTQNEQENTDQTEGPEHQQPGYQPVSQHHSSLASWQMQPVSEADGKEVPHPVEVPGSIPENSTQHNPQPPIELPERHNQ